MKPKYLKISTIYSHWYSNILDEWKPDQEYINYLKKKIQNKEYMVPILVVQEKGGYIIVNGHHRFYAQLCLENEYIKGFILDGTFKDTEPLREAEVLLKYYDKKTEYKFQFSAYLDRWAATAENKTFINKYRPIYRISIYSGFKRFSKHISNKLFKIISNGK